MSVADRYATFANFGGGNQLLSSRPLIKSVVISECIKRRLPSKHYVSCHSPVCVAGAGCIRASTLYITLRVTENVKGICAATYDAVLLQRLCAVQMEGGSRRDNNNLFICVTCRLRESVSRLRYQASLSLLLLAGLQNGGGVDQRHLIRSLPSLQHVL